MSKLRQLINVLLFILVLTIFSVGTFLNRNMTISNFENRKLETFPLASKAGILTGQYFNSLDKYVSDHLLGRDLLVKKYMEINMNLLKKSRINDVVFGKDKFLLNFNEMKSLNTVKKESDSYIINNAKNISELSKDLKSKGKNFYFVSIPTGPKYNFDKYPSYLNNIREEQLYVEDSFYKNLDKNVKYINMRTVFDQHKDQRIYYKTDHHWSMQGVFLGYENLINKIHIDYPQIELPHGKDDFNIERIDTFHGSYNRQIFNLFNSDDYLELWYPKYKIPSYNKVVDGKVDNTIYYKENASKFNSYSTYMNGDNSEIVITTNRPKLPKALIFGDSFTNPIEPFIAQHFNETRILDFRYYKEMNLYQYIDKYDPEVVIFLMNAGDLDGAGGNLNFK